MFKLWKRQQGRVRLQFSWLAFDSALAAQQMPEVQTVRVWMAEGKKRLLWIAAETHLAQYQCEMYRGKMAKNKNAK